MAPLKETLQLDANEWLDSRLSIMFQELTIRKLLKRGFGGHWMSLRRTIKLDTLSFQV